MSTQNYDFFGLAKKTLLVAALIAIVFLIVVWQYSYLYTDTNDFLPVGLAQPPELPLSPQPAYNSTPSPQSSNNSNPEPIPYDNPEPLYYDSPQPNSETQRFSPSPELMKNPPCIEIMANPDCDLKCSFNKTMNTSIKCKIFANCTPEVSSARLWAALDGYLGPLDISNTVIEDELIVDITYTGGEPYKLNTMAKYKVEITSIQQDKKRIFSTEISRGCRIALLFAGRLGRLVGGGEDEGPVINQTSPSHKRHFIYPNLDAGCVVDIFAHTWVIGLDDWFKDHYSPWLVSFKSEPYPGRGKMIVSMERAIQMRKDYEKEKNISYDYVAFMRYDVHLFSNYTMTHMNLDLLYISNWCKASSPERLESPTPNHYKCSPANAGAFWPEGRSGAPDFFFSGTPATTDTAFIGMWDDTENRRFYWDVAVPELHNYFGGRLFNLHDNKKIQLGRYRYHEMDYDLIRYITLIPGRGVYNPDYLFYWKKTDTVLPEDNCPYLKQNYPYWDSTINHQYDHRISRKESYCCPDRSNLWYYCLKKEYENNLSRAFQESK